VALQRIKLADNQAMTVNAYTFPINPTRVEISDAIDQSKIEIIDDSDAYQRKSVNSATHRLVWLGPNITPQLISLLGVLRSYFYSGSRVKYIHLGTVDYLSWGAKKIFLVNLSTKVRDGGPLYYDEVVLEFQEERVA
jgi:hypothetical protein